MNIQVSTTILLPLLQASNSIVDRKHNQPILSNLLLSVFNKKLTITATDLELELTSVIGVNCTEEGQVALPARKLLDICRALPNDAELKITTKENQVKVTSGKSRFILSALPAKEFPLAEGEKPGEELEISRELLIELFNKTSFAMASQDVRYYLNGLLLEMGDKTIRAVATDGHRLALSESKFSKPDKSLISIIVPRKGVIEALKLLSAGNSKKIKLICSNNSLCLLVGNQTLKIKLLEGNFPDYNRVIPEESNNYMLADREQLKSVLTRTSILSNEKFRGIRLTLNKNSVKAVAHNPEKEEAEEEFQVEYKGDDLEVGFNVAYLLDVLGILNCDTVRLDVIDANSSCLIKDPKQQQTKYVVMPMRL